LARACSRSTAPIGWRLNQRDECLNTELFYSLREAQIIIENWRREFNAIRPRSSLG
jgi:transposase InsO family protein